MPQVAVKLLPGRQRGKGQAQVALRGEVNGFIHGPTNDLVVYRDVTKN